MKLTQAHRDIIRYTTHNAACSMQEISDRLGYKLHVVRRCLDQLLEHKVISRSIMCNFYKLGYTPHNLHFSLAAREPKKKAAILDRIICHPQVSWLGGITGELSYELTFLARTLREFTTFIDQLNDEFGTVFEKKKLGTELCHNYFGPKFISTTPTPIPIFTFEESAERVELDHIDSTLMYYLCFNGEVPLAGMAKKLGIALSTLNYRKARLQEQGILLGDVHFLDRDRFAPASYNVMLSVAHGDSAFREELMKFCRIEPHLFCCHRCVGDWDYKIGILGENLASISAVLENLKDRFGKNIASLDVVTVTRHYKDAFFPFYRELQQVTRISSLEQRPRAVGE